MWIQRKDLQKLVFGDSGGHRFTQDSPVMPDVWFGFGRYPAQRHGLLMLPRRGVSPAELQEAIRTDGKAHKFSGAMGSTPLMGLANDESYVVGRLDLDELGCLILPVSPLGKHRGA